VIHSVVGDPKVIEAAAKTLVPAVKAAGVRRVVYLSTASVHGQNPQDGTTEDSPLSDQQEIAYNNAKVRAELMILSDARRLGVEVIALRPSVVFGPRDRWVSVLANELESGRAWLIDGGQGICNSIYVDNLIHAIRLALECEAAATGKAYLVGDAERVTWADFYDAVATGMRIKPSGIQHIATPEFQRPGIMDLLEGVRASDAAQKVIAQIPARLKSVAKGAVRGFRSVVMPDPWVLPGRKPVPCPTLEMVRLQQCRYRLPWSKAERMLGYQPVETFQTGIERSLAWLRWARS
jgi:2-alkyl-3-oxoalkanoate reductase